MSLAGDIASEGIRESLQVLIYLLKKDKVPSGDIVAIIERLANNGVIDYKGKLFWM